MKKGKSNTIKKSIKGIVLLVLFPFLTLAQTDTLRPIELFRADRLGEAQRLFLQWLEKNPNSETATKYLGEIAGQRKQWKEAEGYFQKLKQDHPTTADYHFKYGGALAMQAQEMNIISVVYYLGDIIGSFEKAIQYQPNHIEARWALIEVYIQLPGILGGSREKAWKYADELMEISPVDGYLSKGHVEEFYKNYELAEQYFLKAVKISGGSKNSYKRLISLYKKMKEEGKAEAIRLIYNQKYSK
ncbi:MAG: hypothetical protein H6584_00920 [Flavobacteriales bacterium]|nr:hypothetical protein [Flavobacteriales bacterium]